jgi:hypothetical protein
MPQTSCPACTSSRTIAPRPRAGPDRPGVPPHDLTGYDAGGLSRGVARERRDQPFRLRAINAAQTAVTDGSKFPGRWGGASRFECWVGFDLPSPCRMLGRVRFSSLSSTRAPTKPRATVSKPDHPTRIFGGDLRNATRAAERGPGTSATAFATQLAGTPWYGEHRRTGGEGDYPRFSVPCGKGRHQTGPREANFKTAALNRSATLPRIAHLLRCLRRPGLSRLRLRNPSTAPLGFEDSATKPCKDQPAARSRRVNRPLTTSRHIKDHGVPGVHAPPIR